MSVSVVFAIAGVIALLVGTIGGGIKAKELEVPVISTKVRIINIIVGLVLVGFTVWIELGHNLGASQTPDSQSLPAAESSSTAEPTDSDSQAVDPAPTIKSGDLEEMYSMLSEAKTWDLVLEDSFNNNDSNWPLWNVEDEYKLESMQIADGVLRWGVKLYEADKYFLAIAPVYSYSDFYCSVKVRRVGESVADPQAVWGLIFMRHGNDFYAFRLTDDQTYSVQRHDQYSWTELVGFTRSQFVELDKFNELTVIANDSNFYFFINGTPIGKIADTSYPDGNIGLIVGLDFLTDAPIYFEFDDFELRQK